jgi:hypothetical protein
LCSSPIAIAWFIVRVCRTGETERRFRPKSYTDFGRSRTLISERDRKTSSLRLSLSMAWAA